MSMITMPQPGSLLEEESSLSDPMIGPSEDDEETGLTAVTYSLVENGTKRRGTKLIDSNGYSYNVKRRRVNATNWQCTVRPKMEPCRATVTQRSDSNFQSGAKAYSHPAEVGAATASKISYAIKERALADIFKPASAVVNEVLHSRHYLIKFHKR